MLIYIIALAFIATAAAAAASTYYSYKNRSIIMKFAELLPKLDTLEQSATATVSSLNGLLQKVIDAEGAEGLIADAQAKQKAAEDTARDALAQVGELSGQLDAAKANAADPDAVQAVGDRLDTLNGNLVAIKNAADAAPTPEAPPADSGTSTGTDNSAAAVQMP